MSRTVLLKIFGLSITFLIATNALSDPLSDLWHDFRNGEINYNKALGRLRDARSKVTEYNNIISQAKNNQTSLSNGYNQARSQLQAVQAQINTEIQKFYESGKRAANYQEIQRQHQLNMNGLMSQRDAVVANMNRIAEEFQRLRDQFLNSELVAYSTTTKGAMTYNFKTQSFYGEADLGFGVKYDSKKIEGLLSGQFAVPRIDPVQFAASSAQIRLTHYLDYEAARADYLRNHPNGASYFASERFVDWASLETMAHHIAIGAISGGLTAEQSIQEVQDQFFLEFNDIYAWLLQTGVQNVEEVAACAVSNLLGEYCEIAEMSAAVEVISCSHGGEARWTSQIPKQLIPNVSTSITGISQSSHIAFGLTIHSVNPDYRNKILSGTVEDHSEAAQRMFEIAINRLLENQSPKAMELFRNFDVKAIASRVKNQVLSNQFFQNTFGISPDQILNQTIGISDLLDLHGTMVEQVMHQQLFTIAQGNQAEVNIEKLEFDLSTVTLTVKFSVIHRHSWGSVGDAINAVNDWYRANGIDFTLTQDNLVGHVLGEAQRAAAQAGAEASATYQQLEGSVQNAANLVNNAYQQVLSEVNYQQQLINWFKTQKAVENAIIQNVGSLARTINKNIGYLNSYIAARADMSQYIYNVTAEVNQWADYCNKLREKINNFQPTQIITDPLEIFQLFGDAPVPLEEEVQETFEAVSLDL